MMPHMTNSHGNFKLKCKTKFKYIFRITLCKTHSVSYGVGIEFGLFDFIKSSPLC